MSRYEAFSVSHSRVICASKLCKVLSNYYNHYIKFVNIGGI